MTQKQEKKGNCSCVVCVFGCGVCFVFVLYLYLVVRLLLLLRDALCLVWSRNHPWLKGDLSETPVAPKQHTAKKSFGQGTIPWSYADAFGLNLTDSCLSCIRAKLISAFWHPDCQYPSKTTAAREFKRKNVSLCQQDSKCSHYFVFLMATARTTNFVSNDATRVSREIRVIILICIFTRSTSKELLSCWPDEMLITSKGNLLGVTIFYPMDYSSWFGHLRSNAAARVTRDLHSE